MVSVEAITEIATSFVPCTAACFGSEPRSICVVTFSSTTIASSTTIPMAIDRDESEIILIVFPVIARYMKEAINESGIVIQIINVARQRPKKRNTTITTNNRAYITVSAKLSIVFRMLSEVSTITPSFTSLGRFFCKRGRASSTLREISTELAPDCF